LHGIPDVKKSEVRFRKTLVLCSKNSTFFNVSYLAPKVF